MNTYKKERFSENISFKCFAPNRGTILLTVGTERFITSEENKDPFSTHSHRYVEIMYVEKGTLTFAFHNTKHLVQANDILIIPAEVSHSEVWEMGEGKYYLVSISALPTEAVYTQNNFLLRNTPQNESIGFYVKALVREIKEKRERYQELCQGLFTCLINELYRYNTPASSKKRPKRASGIAEGIQAYIHENYREEICLNDLSRSFFFSEQYLVKKFKKSFGCTPKQYLLRVRIQASGYLLLKRDNTIAQIGTHVGFHSSLAFLYNFKRLLGISPSEFRENYKTDIQKGLAACTLTSIDLARE